MSIPSPRARPAAFLAALALVLVPAGCGGDDEESAADTAAQAAVSGENVRLTQAEWDEYVTTRDQARAVNQQATKTFSACRDIVNPSVPAEKVDECLGTSADKVVEEGKNVLATLDGLTSGTGGECAKASADLEGNVKLYTASVQSVSLSVEQGNIASVQAGIDESLAALTRSRAASAAFETACKPA